MIKGQPNRLAAPGLVDRDTPISFTFDGKRLEGFAGDTLASALLASGKTLVGRSFKYHRPRGIVSAGSEEPNALVELRRGARREPNTRATMVELYEGLAAASQNRWPSLTFDAGAVNSIFSKLFVAGFYYKTFMWPAAFWEKAYEPLIRRAAGLGRASIEPDPDRYEKAHAFCDVLIVGGGPAGLAAALSAGRSGARVILADDDFAFGGRLNCERSDIDGMAAAAWVRQAEAEFTAMPEVRLMRRTTVFGLYDSGTYGAVERVSDHLPTPQPHQPRQRLWKIVARQAILASGAIERPIVFGDNDKPNVMLASAVRTYINRFGVTPGRNVSIFTSCDDGWRTAFDLVQAGVHVPAIVDPRSEVRPALMARASGIGARVMLGASVIGTAGSRGLRRIVVRERNGRMHTLASDALAVSGGYNPTLGLTTHLGARPRWSDAIAAFIPDNLPPGMQVAGAVRGVYALADVLREGAATGARAAEAAGFTVPDTPVPRASDEPTDLMPLWHVTGSRGKAFIDFQHDVTADDVALAAREGFSSAELLKRYTTLGMGTDQGKTSNINGHAITAALTGQSIPAIGTTVSRPPYTPVAIGALAGHHRGEHFRPTRLTPSHDWALENGATFVDAGLWRRAQWFALPDETDWLSTVSREVRTVRSKVGVCDVSTLGKIEIHGSDSGVFLDRIYVNSFSTLPVGKTRYGLMLREDGCVLDDGTSARLAPDRYVMSTTTANAARVMQHLEHARQVLWPELDVQMVSVTEQWAQYVIAGPLSRELLTPLLGGAMDISNEAFPYLGCAEFAWRGLEVRLFRISFSGELAYELAVPASYGDAIIRAITDAGADLGVCRYGTEALGVMRIEKGHVAGNELNGTTTASDLGLGRMMSAKKDFIGRVLARRPGMTDPARPALVGVKPVDRTMRLSAGAHFLPIGAEASLANDQGYLTSAAFSPMLGHSIGLALIARGPRRIGERLRAYDPLRGKDIEVELCLPVFFDPEGARLHA